MEDNVKVAQAQLNVANSLLAANQAQVKQFAAALQSAQFDLDHTNIKAPVDGVVVSRNVDVGQTVAASLAAPTLFLIAQDLTKMQVDTNVSEADVGRVQVNQPATFTVDAYPGRVFKGAVTSIRKAPINVANVITYDAVIGVSNQDLKLFPGMTANVKILVNQRQNVLRVPNAALRYHPASETTAGGGTASARKGAAPEKAVWVLDANNKEQRVVVTTGESDGTFAEISEGHRRRMPVRRGHRPYRARRRAGGLAIETYQYFRRLTDLPFEIIQSTHDKYTTAARARELLGGDTPLHHLHPIEAANHTFRGAVAALLAQLQNSLDQLTAVRAENWPTYANSQRR